VAQNTPALGLILILIAIILLFVLQRKEIYLVSNEDVFYVVNGAALF